jgi:hypothetical protein
MQDIGPNPPPRFQPLDIPLADEPLYQGLRRSAHGRPAHRGPERPPLYATRSFRSLCVFVVCDLILCKWRPVGEAIVTKAGRNWHASTTLAAARAVPPPISALLTRSCRKYGFLPAETKPKTFAGASRAQPDIILWLAFGEHHNIPPPKVHTR